MANVLGELNGYELFIHVPEAKDFNAQSRGNQNVLPPAWAISQIIRPNIH